MKKFNNYDLQRDLSKIKAYDHYDIHKESYADEGTNYFTIEVNDGAYSYYDQGQRNQDYNQLKKLIDAWKLLK